jgi:hypothetical protein
MFRNTSTSTQAGKAKPKVVLSLQFSKINLESTAQHSTAQHSTAQHSTAQHSTAQHSRAEQSRAIFKGTILPIVSFISKRA